MNDVELHVLRCQVAEQDKRIKALEDKLAFLAERDASIDDPYTSTPAPPAPATTHGRDPIVPPFSPRGGFGDDRP